MRGRGIAVAVIVIVAGLIALSLASDFLVDWLWFSAIGYFGVFRTILGAKAVLFFAAFTVSTVVLWINGTVALRFAQRRGSGLPVAFERASASVRTLPGTLPEPFGLASHGLPWRSLIAGGVVVLGLLIAVGETGNWDVALRFIHQAPYGLSDPLYGKDIAFFLFSLPAYVALKNWTLTTLVLSALVAGAVYWAHGDIMLDEGRQRMSSAALTHGSALLGFFFAVKAWTYGLDRFLLLYHDNGVVVGAGYTDVHVELPALWVLMVLAFVGALASWANMWVRMWKLPAIGAALVFGGSLVLALVFPALFQRVYVKPNELQLEAPYIQRNITLTQEAYNLRQITVKPFPAEQGLTFQSLQDNRATIDNIRLWDWQPLMTTYAQLQEIRTYYKFHQVDVDRYELDGSYQQVMLSARELEPALIPPNAQTWVNLHVLFTHGSGVVMSPVTRKSAEGLPMFYLQDIPPIASGGPAVREPRIYFGQGADSYVIVKASTPEFDYPKGKDNVYATYDGADGVAVGSFARRTLFGWYFDDPNILLSSYITDESRILFRRNIQKRVGTIAPFLRLDRDPYIVISNGRLFWMQDAYTTSRWFPYAQPLPDGGTTYIRNSVKVVIDAYNGSVDFYVSDPSDAVVATYRSIFPELFKRLEAMPPDLQKHIRYPEDLFLIQAQVYRIYHMDAPEVFYNREDLWQFPREPTAADGVRDRDGAKMAPYYINMRLPGEMRAEFFLMLPMVPSQRENMIAWLAARCDQPDYGKLIVYEFPKDKLVYGPFQIDARINQNTDISQQISLWNQMGSRVIRGNQLVVPIENSILYVSPLYLRAETGQLPELKRVIAAYGDHVVMEETLAGALAALFKETTPASLPPSAPAESAIRGPTDDRAREALSHYGRAIERLKAGDWAGFGAELDALRPILEELSHQ
ncbi:MAG: UPF0182 family protein [Proteobacteria bacterium]|nr:UPF0182 family protein [Pseudomonadota bacterium]